MVPTLHPLIRAARSLTDLFLPLCCPGCRSTPLDPNEFLCMDCRTTLPFTRFEVLRGNPVEKLFWGRLPLLLRKYYTVFHRSLPHPTHCSRNQIPAPHFPRPVHGQPDGTSSVRPTHATSHRPVDPHAPASFKRKKTRIQPGGIALHRTIRSNWYSNWKHVHTTQPENGHANQKKQNRAVGQCTNSFYGGRP